MSDSTDDEPRLFLLTLRGLPDEVPVYVRLRRALKCLRRSFGLKCVAIAEMKTQSTPPEGGGSDDEVQGPPVCQRIAADED